MKTTKEMAKSLKTRGEEKATGDNIPVQILKELLNKEWKTMTLQDNKIYVIGDWVNIKQRNASLTEQLI